MPDPAEESGNPEDTAPDPAIPGLLPPVMLLSRTPEEAQPAPALPDPAAGPDLTQLGQIRRQMADDMLLANIPATFAISRGPALRAGWISLLIGLALAVPVLFAWTAPPGATVPATGVAATHAAVARLPRDATVLVLWAYDPATAGELDLVMRPVLDSLRERNAQLVGVSLLPNGPATARRLMATATDARTDGATLASSVRRLYFLPGGTAALPLVGQELGWLTGDDPGAPRLAVVAAAQAESVQEWLEQVQPLNQAPVIAVTAASAAPILQPYLDSGQLAGLVSGFDGAAAYASASQAVASRAASRAGDGQVQAALGRQMVYQNWATVAILLVLAAGNLVSLSGRNPDHP